MSDNGKVESLGSFYEMIAPYAAEGERITKEAELKKTARFNGYVPMEVEKEDLVAQYEFVEEMKDQITEIAKILDKAGIDLKLFPFKPVKNKEGEIMGYVPKGKNEKEIKENIAKYKNEVAKALEENKITQEEFDKVNDNLEDLMKENGIKPEEEKEQEEIEISEREIYNTLEGLKERLFGNKFEEVAQAYAQYGEEYNQAIENNEEEVVDKREAFLNKFNTAVNTKLKISGVVEFTNGSGSIPYEDSFMKNGKGYRLSKGDINATSPQELNNLLYSMVERSMMRKTMLKGNNNIDAAKRQEIKAMHEKLLAAKQKREEQQKREEEKRDKNQAKKYIRSMYGG